MEPWCHQASKKYPILENILELFSHLEEDVRAGYRWFYCTSTSNVMQCWPDSQAATRLACPEWPIHLNPAATKYCKQLPTTARCEMQGQKTNCVSWLPPFMVLERLLFSPVCMHHTPWMKYLSSCTEQGRKPQDHKTNKSRFV